MPRYSKRMRVLLVALCAGVACAATIGSSGAMAGAPQNEAQAAHSRYAPVIQKTDKPPTGYAVTFRFWAPTATSVQIKGDWYFADPSTLSAPASTETSTVATPGLLPSQWKPGDFPIASPNTTSMNFPVLAMTKDKRTGVWTFTTPLPSGIFSYGFFVDCASSTQTGCAEISDPANPPRNQSGSHTTGSVEAVSQVYVPSDSQFGTVDFSWQAPAAKQYQGTLTDVTYPSPASVTPVGENYLAVYTPPGYNPHRATPYPTLYLSHGGGGNETDWSTQGGLGAILDNLIGTGQIQPMVVVMPNAYTFANVTAYADYDANLVNSVIPYVQSHYRVSTAVSERAFAGLSMGGAITNSLLFNDTAEFGYFGVLSPGFQGAPPYGNGHYNVPAASSLTANQITGLKGVGIYVGGGWQDPIHFVATSEVSTLSSVGVSVSPDYINGGHEWYVWRILLRDFLTRVAFFPPVAG